MGDEHQGASRGELAVMAELRGLRADLHTVDSKRDAMIVQSGLLAQSLETLVLRVEEIAKRDEADHAEMRVSIDAMRLSLDGNDDKPGLRTRVDRLEQVQLAEKKAREWIGRVAAALVASGVTAAIAWVVHK